MADKIPIVPVLVAALLAAALTVGWVAHPAMAQPAATSSEVKRSEKQLTEAIEALETLANLLANREENRKAGEKLRSELKEADEPAIKK